MADSEIILVDGSLDFSGGVDSVKVPTVQSSNNPNGLGRNQLAWLSNGTLRDGGINQRTGWQPLGQIVPSNFLFQGAFMYEPIDESDPYLIVSVSGHIYAVQVGAGFLATELTKGNASLLNPASIPQAFFCQAEQFLVIQAGDNKTLPLFWDGSKLRRSKGITNRAVAPGTPGVNEIPAGTAMDYYQNRLWYAQGRSYSAGDMVGGPSGTAVYGFNDAILNVTENPLVLGGDGFTVPSQAGNIRSIFHNANLDSTLGQGNLYIGTRKAIYSLTVPVTRTDWINASSANQPRQTVAQINNGTVNDRSIAKVNGDAFYQSLAPDIRSLNTAVKNFGVWGNIALSNNEQRILAFNDRSLLKFASGIFFDNRLLQTALPLQTPQGVVHQALIPLDFVPMSEFNTTEVPNWEGQYQGLQFFQLFTGDFGGRERAFSIVRSVKDASIHVWELTTDQRFENGDQRVQWYMEFPAFTAGDETQFKQLVGAEVWVDKIFGEVIFQMDYRPDGDTCYHPWHLWKLCTARNSCEDVNNPVCYPLTPFRESYRQMVSLPEPQTVCQPVSGRPTKQGYQFQCRLTITGWCRVRGLFLYMKKVKKELYRDIICTDQNINSVTS